ncbi:general stress protein [Mesorhizobium sp. Root157]|uniref:pyridoxamine 5'-phosphate oxidase family protein n=1 Tax=Mesorhizobium sp. Root157 TaxID=1736477 RepID=UPI0006F20F4B|nr:pyridoxamine 5'-phosphate oxidase family protein [Mesorhizobium sp. Root157]KQZ87061.1 general stress protein [Mesorhizobium sp. Root157]
MAENNGPERVWDLVEKIRFCMLATNDGKDIRSRPMTAHAERSENAVYFLLDLKDHKDLKAFASSCLAFADSGDMDFVSVTGTGEISNDRAKIDELWSAPYKAFWDGPDDPNIRILKITPKDAQYWDGPGKVISYAKMLAAAVTDAKPALGEHGKVRM